MHIPDGFLTANILLPTWVVSIGGMAYCVKRASRSLKEKAIPLMGVMAAFIFAAQMLNFPVISGTSGHLLGGTLAVIFLGPYAGAIIIAVVLIVQCVLFQDGGLAALGSNILNMALVGSMLAYPIYNLARKLLKGNRGVLFGTAIAAWSSVVLASAMCALELAISGTSPLNIALPAMTIIHAFIGIGETIISVLVVSFVIKVRPDLIYEGGKI